MSSRLFRPWPLPPIPGVRDGGQNAKSKKGKGGKTLGADHGILLGRRGEYGYGELIARFFDARTRFSSTNQSRRWRLNFKTDADGAPLRDSRRRLVASKEFGYWADLNVSQNYSDAGESYAAQSFAVPFGTQSGPFRDLNVQFYQIADAEQKVTLPKPPQLITSQGPLGKEEFSVIHSTIDTGIAEGFMMAPPQSHFMDADPDSATFAKYIEPQESIITPAPEGGFWQASTMLRSRLKPGLSYMRLWCPTGEYCEFDTYDKEHFKVTRDPAFGAEEVSLPIKAGVNEASYWDVYLTPRTIQMQAEWWDYYFAITPFSFFVLGLHNIFNTLDRLPNFPVPYGYVGGQFEDTSLVSDWVYYVSQWHGPFSPGIAQAHPRPVGFEDAGGDANFDPSKLSGGIWEGPPIHGSDYAVEYAIKHGALAKHNPHDFETFSVFFAIVYDSSSAVSYFARLTLQQPGDLVAKVKTRGRSWEKAGDTFYIWQRKLKADQIQKTISWGTMFVDFEAGADFWSTDAALKLGGWT